MKKLTLLLLCSLVIISCDDKITENSTQTIERPRAEIPGVNDGDSLLSPYSFSGIVGDPIVTADSVTLNWIANQNAANYSVFFVKETGELNFIQSLKASESSVTIQNLTPNTQYRFLVRMMDFAGRVDNNKSVKTVTTLDLPVFDNQFSMRFNGSESLQSSATNDIFKYKNLSLSLWFKTSDPHVGDSFRLINLHKRLLADEADFRTAIAIGIENQKLFIIYTDSQNQLKRVDTAQIVTDSSWHHIVLTYDQRHFQLFLDNNQILLHADSLFDFGSTRLNIGSFIGIQKAYKGYIDEISFWNSALNQFQISKLYNGGAAGNLRSLGFISEAITWFRMGDNNELATKIKDVLSGHDATSTQLSGAVFTQDSP